MLKRLKALAGTIIANRTEVYVYLLITVGLPLVAYLYLDWKAAVTVFVVTQIIVGFLALRESK